MINLLPPQEKEVILSEAKKKIAIIIFFLILFFFACLILISISIRVYLQGYIESEKSSLAQSEKEFSQSESQNLQERIKSINSLIKELNSFYSQRIYFSETAERISKTLPENFYLTNFSLVLSGEKEISVSLSGFAPLREDLFKFKENLEAEEGFKDISFPPANWVKAQNIDFYVTFKIKR
ncbi:MAG: PilN domain-containing protein [bacterium]|nr:PilN domain-containing protein [bacterium]